MGCGVGWSRESSARTTEARPYGGLRKLQPGFREPDAEALKYPGCWNQDIFPVGEHSVTFEKDRRLPRRRRLHGPVHKWVGPATDGDKLPGDEEHEECDDYQSVSCSIEASASSFVPPAS